MSEPWIPEDLNAEYDRHVDPDPDRREPRSVTHWDFEPVEVKVCGFCKNEPVGNAARWYDPDASQYAPCPRCGRLEVEL